MHRPESRDRIQGRREKAMIAEKREEEKGG